MDLNKEYSEWGSLQLDFSFFGLLELSSVAYKLIISAYIIGAISLAIWIYLQIIPYVNSL